jgi:hypothetical protein
MAHDASGGNRQEHDNEVGQTIVTNSVVGHDGEFPKRRLAHSGRAERSASGATSELIDATNCPSLTISGHGHNPDRSGQEISFSALDPGPDNQYTKPAIATAGDRIRQRRRMGVFSAIREVAHGRYPF